MSCDRDREKRGRRACAAPARLIALLISLAGCSEPAPHPPAGAPSAGAPVSVPSAAGAPARSAPGAAPPLETPLGLANLAASLASSGDLAGAEAALLRALGIEPEAPAALAELARVRLAAGKAAQAVEPAVRAADRGGGSDGRMFLLATSARVRAGQALEAETDLERWGRRFGTSPLLRVARGLLHESEGRRSAAEREYRSALASEPGCEEALSGLVKLRFEAGDAQGVLEAVRAARAAGVAPRVWESQALRRLGRLEEAEAPLRSAIASEPEHPVALAELGSLLARRGDYRAARDLLARALALQPGLEAARANLAEVERRLAGSPSE